MVRYFCSPVAGRRPPSVLLETQIETNGGNTTITINLKDFYPWYGTDEFIEAPEEVLLEILDILEALPEIQSRRIRAHIILEMTLSEIALQEEVSIATVQRAIQRGIKKIQKFLTPDG